MSQPTDQTNRFEHSMLVRMREDADELLRTAERARRLVDERSWGAFSRWSDLLRDVLPADTAAVDRIARAVELDPQILRAVKNARMDPLDAPARPLHMLARLFGLSASLYRGLIGADHDRFVSAAQVFRSGRPEDPSAWQAFDAAWEELEQEDPSRF